MRPKDQPQLAEKPAELSQPATYEHEELSRHSMNLDNFNWLAKIGKGNSATVMLAETRNTKEIYAIKILQKSFLVENDEVLRLTKDKSTLLKARDSAHPFIARLYWTFQTEVKVYFVMEYVPGGSLMFHIQKGAFGVERSRFYAAEVCLALRFLHKSNILHRNLKLDNVMLSLDGHIKLVSFGVSKELSSPDATTATFCGSPEFMAPEILLDKPYGLAVDWWAFGVILYQMLLHRSPFESEDEDEIYDAILGSDPLYPPHIAEDAQSILRGLLRREPRDRLGSNGGFDEVKLQSFFSNIDWDALYKEEVSPSFIPQVGTAADVSNFDPCITSVMPILDPSDVVSSSIQQNEFRDFIFIPSGGELGSTVS